MACCCFWFIHPAMAITTNRNGFKMFRILAAYYLLAGMRGRIQPRHLCFQSDPVFGHYAKCRRLAMPSVLTLSPAYLQGSSDAQSAAAPVLTGGTLAEVEREYIIRVLRETGGVISAAATRLGVPRTTLNAMMRKLGISRKNL
jgi:transcriptional regulator with GAF, ATPase, and Fis domain